MKFPSLKQVASYVLVGVLGAAVPVSYHTFKINTLSNALEIYYGCVVFDISEEGTVIGVVKGYTCPWGDLLIV